MGEHEDRGLRVDAAVDAPGGEVVAAAACTECAELFGEPVGHPVVERIDRFTAVEPRPLGGGVAPAVGVEDLHDVVVGALPDGGADLLEERVDVSVHARELQKGFGGLPCPQLRRHPDVVDAHGGEDAGGEHGLTPTPVREAGVVAVHTTVDPCRFAMTYEHETHGGRG